MRQNLDTDISRYIGDTLGLAPPALAAWAAVVELPRYLSQRYDLRALTLLQSPCMLVLPVGDMPALEDMHKHLQLLAQRAQCPVLLGLDGVTLAQRKRLINRHIAFVVPDRQLYLPPLGIDLRERFAAAPRKPAAALSPSTQAILFAGLLGRWQAAQHSAGIARALGYSAMTLTRARKELEEHALLVPTTPGLSAPKSPWMLTIGTRALFHDDQYLGILRSPVVRRVWIAPGALSRDSLLQAGLSALAAQTMVVAPSVAVFAMAESHFKALASRRVEVFEAPHPGCVELELWAYDPAAVADDAAPWVDSLSLYLSLDDAAVHDERIAQARDQLLERFDE